MWPQRQEMAIWGAALWWGSLTTVGFGVVPMLFAHLPTTAMAGAMAATLFSALTWLAVLCGLLLLLVTRQNPDDALDLRLKNASVFIVSGMLLALFVEFAVAPRIVARQDLRLWHSVGTVMYVLQWLCATFTLRHFASKYVSDNQESVQPLMQRRP
jgi:hypothetical protein